MDLQSPAAHSASTVEVNCPEYTTIPLTLRVQIRDVFPGYGQGEELYEVAKDPHQWENLAEDPRYDQAKAKLKKWLPKKNAPHFRAVKP